MIKGLREKISQKDEFAEGLFLIDFEKLKIENQTMCEKIERKKFLLH